MTRKGEGKKDTELLEKIAGELGGIKQTLDDVKTLKEEIAAAVALKTKGVETPEIAATPEPFIGPAEKPAGWEPATSTVSPTEKAAPLTTEEEEKAGNRYTELTEGLREDDSTGRTIAWSQAKREVIAQRKSPATAKPTPTSPIIKSEPSPVFESDLSPLDDKEKALSEKRYQEILFDGSGLSPVEAMEQAEREIKSKRPLIKVATTTPAPAPSPAPRMSLAELALKSDIEKFDIKPGVRFAHLTRDNSWQIIEITYVVPEENKVEYVIESDTLDRTLAGTSSAIKISDLIYDIKEKWTAKSGEMLDTKDGIRYYKGTDKEYIWPDGRKDSVVLAEASAERLASSKKPKWTPGRMLELKDGIYYYTDTKEEYVWPDGHKDSEVPPALRAAKKEYGRKLETGPDGELRYVDTKEPYEYPASYTGRTTPWRKTKDAEKAVKMGAGKPLDYDPVTGKLSFRDIGKESSEPIEDEFTAEVAEIKARLARIEEKERKIAEVKAEITRLSAVERKLAITEMAEYFKKGLDRVVVHGDPRYAKDEEGETYMKSIFGLDMDAEAAMYWLNYGQDFSLVDGGNSLPKNIYNHGANIEIVKKGEITKGAAPTWIPGKKTPKEIKTLADAKNIDWSKYEKDEKERRNDEGNVVLHIDTGGRRISIENRNGEIVYLFADHHAKIDNTETSSGEMIFEAMVEAGMIKKEPWMERLVKLGNDVDNILYTREKTFNEEYYRNVWPRTLQGISEELPYETVIKLVRAGADAKKPFTDEEATKILVPKKIKNKDPEKKDPKTGRMLEWITEMVPLKNFIDAKMGQVNYSIKTAKFARKRMEEQNLRKNTEEFGEILYHTQDYQERIVKGEKKMMISKIPNPGPTASALGLDTYIAYNEKSKKYFINSTTHDLWPIYLRLKKIIPETIMVRDVMILPPQDEDDRKGITREKFLEACAMIRKMTKIGGATHTYKPKGFRGAEYHKGKAEEKRKAAV